uniref:EF-hand domain-containing protein n=1 Tax=Anopheles merus TaxID=30066 RepID=A0A182V8J0_ANOME
MDDEEQRMLIMRKAFQMFDTQKTGFIETIKISTILNTMGQLFDEGELQDLIDEEDPESTGRVNFDGFANIASNFLQEEEDAEAMQQELKEAFRLYDREGNGYITTRYGDIGEDEGGSCCRYVVVTSVLFHQLHTHTHTLTQYDNRRRARRSFLQMLPPAVLFAPHVFGFFACTYVK